jgi:15-cis-phytoene desaturase
VRVMVIGAGLAGLAAAERLLDAGVEVVVVDSFPRPGGRTANFDVSCEVAGLIPGDVVEHGLHAWFQHYRALFGLMQRAGVPKPPFAGEGVHLWNPRDGHVNIPGGPFMWLVRAMGLPLEMRGKRSAALTAFGRLIAQLDRALAAPAETDRESAEVVFARAGVPEEAVRNVFAPCLYSLTSLPLAELSGLEMLRWMAAIIPDPRIRVLQGGGSTAMCEPIMRALARRGADFCLGVEVHRLRLGDDGRVRAELERAPDRTGVRHVLVPGFQPAEPPEQRGIDAIVSTLPWERLVAVCADDPRLRSQPAIARLCELRNIHPLTIRLWFERPVARALERYMLTSGTLFDVVRPTPEPERYSGIRLFDALVEDVERHLPELAYEREQYLTPSTLRQRIVDRVSADLERMYPGQVRGNRVMRMFLHTREGIVACRPGAWEKRATQHLGIANFVLAGDWTRQGWGVCMEGAVRSGQLAAAALLDGARAIEPQHIRPPTYSHLLHSLKTLLDRA